MERISLDSCFLIDLERERSKGSNSGPAHELLATLAATRLTLSPVALGEFATGFTDPLHPVLQNIIQNVEVLPSSISTSLEYAKLFRAMKKQLIGGNDLWIAAYAIDAGLSLVTRNVREFRRVPGLSIIEY